MRRAAPPRPRDGHTLVVGVVARISGCANQREMSLDDQADHARQAVADLYDGPVDDRIVATKGKGERLDRPELADIEAMIRSRHLDLLVVEDIGRLVRGVEATRLCGLAVDHGTRFVAINDCIDTAEENWEEEVIAACRDHVGHNAHTSKRLKQKLMNRFEKLGGATPREFYGYIKPEGAKTYGEWRKDPAAGAVYREWFRRLRADRNSTAVADWLNAEGVPTGRYARGPTWDGKMVRRITRNPLLKGMPGRGFVKTVKNHEVGRRVCVPNLDGPIYRHEPHLAHIDAAEFDEVNALLAAANAGKGHKPVGGADPRLGAPRKRTRFPGQHARCHYCGRQYVWGGNGRGDSLMCNGSRGLRCWNSVGVRGERVAERVAGAVMAELGRLEGLDDQLRGLVEEARGLGVRDLSRARSELGAAEAELARRRGNLARAVEDHGPQPMLGERIAALDAEGRDLARRRRELDREAGRVPELPASAAELRRLFEDKFRALAAGSPEMGDLLRRVAPSLSIHLVRRADGGLPLPRARVTLSLAGLVPDAGLAPAVHALLTRELTIDLFEPTQRERIHAEAARLEGLGLEQRAIAARIGEKPTQTAVFYALSLDRRMRELGLDTPYAYLEGPPEDYPRMCRNRNPKYRFEPEEGYLRPPL